MPNGVNRFLLIRYKGFPEPSMWYKRNENGFTPLFMNETPHIGNLIKEELAQQQRSIAWLARQMGCSRQNLCRQLGQGYLGTDQLLKISLLLHRDFFLCFSEYISNQF